MPISKLIERLRARLDDPAYPEVTEWKNAHPGGKAIGCFPIYSPVEMVNAAGMLPVLIAGAAGKIGLDEADGCLQSFVCSVGRSTLELKLDGFLEKLDGMMFPSICEISRGLSGVWARHDPGKPVIYIHFPQNTRSESAKSYLMGELTRVKDILESIAGAPITYDSLLASFAQYNRRAELLEKLDTMRSDNPARFSGSQSYVLRLSGMRIPPEEHAAILEEALRELEDTPEGKAPKLRMVMLGAFCERPPVSMLESIEENGIAIVADDILLGQSWWKKPLELTGDPIENLAEYYLNEAVPTPVVYRPGGKPCDHLEEMLRRTHADGVLIASAKFCHPAHHDNSCIVRECEKHSIPYLRIEYEEIEQAFESIRLQVEALLEARERLPFAGTGH